MQEDWLSFPETGLIKSESNKQFVTSIKQYHPRLEINVYAVKVCE